MKYKFDTDLYFIYLLLEFIQNDLTMPKRIRKKFLDLSNCISDILFSSCSCGAYYISSYLESSLNNL